MKDYVLLFRGGLDFTTVTQEELQKAMQKWKDWMDQLSAEGRYGGGHRLTSNGLVLTGTKKQLRDGPFMEGKEIVGGAMFLKAADIDEAREIALGCPIFEHDGIVEVREVAPSIR